MNRGYVINRGHYLKRFVINIRASKNISGLVKVTVTSPAGLMKFFLMLSPVSEIKLLALPPLDIKSMTIYLLLSILPMLTLPSSETQGDKDFLKTIQPLPYWYSLDSSR